jgi:hypothetical protein
MAELVVSINGVETQNVHLHKGRTTLGRRNHNDVALADLSVSGFHCVFEQDGQAQVWVQDMGSTNGTFINGQRVTRQLLNDQDVIVIGIYNAQFLGAPRAAESGNTAPMKLEQMGVPGTAGALHASVQVVSGPSAGRSVPLVKTVTTFGKPGEAVLVISHRRNGYYAALVEGGDQPAFVNGKSIGAEAIPLADQDVLELAESRMLFVLG